MKHSEGSIKYVAKNKKAHFLYTILDHYEAGITLHGTEVKSIREGKVSLTEAYCRIQGQEVFIFNLNISPYEKCGYHNHNPLRKRKLLLHRREILKLYGKLILRGYTLIPLTLYFKRGIAKLSLGLAKGRQKADKREYLKNKDAKREMRKSDD